MRRAGLTQSDLAMELGLTRAAVSAWVTGRAEPRSEVRRQMTKVLEGIRQFAPLERWRTGAAVLIGVSDYTHLPSVPSIKNNLSALTEVALTGLGIPHSNVHTVENPTSAAQVHEKIDLAMDAADPVSGGLFIYYAGHGWTDPRNGRLLLRLVESNQHKTWTAMEFDRLREQIADSPVGSRLLVLDSCYSGAALDTLSAGLSSASRIDGTYVMTSSNATNASRAPQGDHSLPFPVRSLRITKGRGRRAGRRGASPVVACVVRTVRMPSQPASSWRGMKRRMHSLGRQMCAASSAIRSGPASASPRT
ncbi:caspase, EACC1-associated type [Streptomyces sp. NBC_00354]|uniref:caspase, EACC1-associated type n=1 Tax=Streptomyces sp. NBC_00354 TaxID=2975723 RepID=UPI002E275B8F